MDDGEDVKAQSLRLEEALEENRDLRHRMEVMEAMMQRFLPPAATPISLPPTATTPVSRSSICNDPWLWFITGLSSDGMRSGMYVRGERKRERNVHERGDLGPLYCIALVSVS